MEHINYLRSCGKLVGVLRASGSKAQLTQGSVVVVGSSFQPGGGQRKHTKPQHEYNRSQSHIFVRSRNGQRERLIWLNLSEFLWTQWAILRLLEIFSIPSRTLLSPVVDAGSDSTNRAVLRVRGPVKGDDRCRRTPPPRKVDARSAKERRMRASQVHIANRLSTAQRQRKFFLVLKEPLILLKWSQFIWTGRSKWRKQIVDCPAAADFTAVKGKTEHPFLRTQGSILAQVEPVSSDPAVHFRSS